MTVRIPQNGKFTQTNKGEIFGNIYRSQNLDFKTNPGKIRASSRLTVNTKSDDNGISGMGVPLAFITHDVSSTKQYYAACGIGTASTSGTGKILVSADNGITSAFTNDATANTPTTIHADYSDMVHWQDSLLVSKFASSTSQISRLTTSWTASWFTGSVAGSFTVQGGCKNMCEGFNGNLYITDDDLIIYVPVSGNAVLSGAGTLDFLGAYRGTWIRSSSDRLWIGLMTFDSNVGSRGYVGMWSGSGTALDALYDIGAPCALSCVIKNDVPYIVDAYGVLRKYDGSGFSEVARLPVANQNIEMPGIYNDQTNSRWIHQRGMDLVDGKININVNNFVSSGVYVEDMPSGIWEYDENIGLYHKMAPCSASTDYGQQQILTAGAIFGSKRTAATMLVGNAYYIDDTTTSKTAIFYDDVGTDTNKRSLVTTPWVLSSQLKDVYQAVDYRFKRLPSGDKILAKYRTYKKANLPFLASITWTSTTTFTSTDTNFQYASVGDEVEITMGKGASTTAHISAISYSNPTYTVTLDDTIGFSSGTAKAKVNNFKRIGAGTISDTDIQSQVMRIPTENHSSRIQVKTEMRFTGTSEIDDITIVSKPYQTL